ncbi:MAG: hypothetical protein HZC49_02740 [Nitrospirae bacterium]|nr:hypothetical protein [Nitrospirota bacterium]
MRRLKTGFYIIILSFFVGCSSGDVWEGVVFLDRGNLLVHVNSGQFKSLEKCEAACMEILNSKNALQKGYYECGKNCKSGLASYNGDCQETVKGNYYK